MSEDIIPRNWYVAIVGNKTERESANKLSRDYEVFLPSQQYVSVWKDGRRKVRERILLPGKLLVCCTEQERRAMLNHIFVKRFLVDIAATPNEFGRRPVAVVPTAQVDRLKFVLGQQDIKVEIDNVNLQPGEHVRVIRGSLMGLEGVVSDWTSPHTRIQIYIEHLGCASVEVALNDIERITPLRS